MSRKEYKKQVLLQFACALLSNPDYEYGKKWELMQDANEFTDIFLTFVDDSDEFNGYGENK